MEEIKRLNELACKHKVKFIAACDAPDNATQFECNGNTVFTVDLISELMIKDPMTVFLLKTAVELKQKMRRDASKEDSFSAHKTQVDQ